MTDRSYISFQPLKWFAYTFVFKKNIFKIINNELEY